MLFNTSYLYGIDFDEGKAVIQKRWEPRKHLANMRQAKFMPKAYAINFYAVTFYELK